MTSELQYEPSKPSAFSFLKKLQQPQNSGSLERS